MNLEVKLFELKQVAKEAIENKYSYFEVVEIYWELKKEIAKNLDLISKDAINYLELAKLITSETLHACGFDGDIEKLLLR